MASKLVIWGVGRITKNASRIMDFREVMFLVDSNATPDSKPIKGKQVLPPSALEQAEFDYLLIAVSQYYEEICNTAVSKYHVPPEKICYWSDYYHYENPIEAFDWIQKDCKCKGYDALVDYSFAWKVCPPKPDGLKLYGISEEKPEFKFFYDQFYEKILSDITVLDKINAPERTAIYLKDAGKDEIFWKRLLEEANELYLFVHYQDKETADKIRDFCEKEKFVLRVVHQTYGRLFCVNKKPLQSTAIYIAMHKEYELPKCSGYIPLWLGDSAKNKWGYKEDKDTPSISHLNEKINECTGLYWMWKHAACDVIGLSHYRRYFEKNAGDNKPLIIEDIHGILQNYDVITAKKVCTSPFTLEEQLRVTVESDALEKGLYLVRTMIDAKCPKYREVFEQCMRGNIIFPCNMMVMRKSIFDTYCTWLFDIIIEAAESIDVSAYGAYSKRVIGFIAERLFTVWLMKQTLRIKEMPLWECEELVDTNTSIERLRKPR